MLRLEKIFLTTKIQKKSSWRSRLMLREKTTLKMLIVSVRIWKGNSVLSQEMINNKTL